MDFMTLAWLKHMGKSNNDNGGSSGDGGDNGNLVLLLSEAEKIDDWHYNFSPITIKDCFDCLSNGNNIFVIDDISPYSSDGIGYRMWNPISNEIYYDVHIDDGNYVSVINLNFTAYYIGDHIRFKEGDTVDSWLDQPLVLTIAD